MEKDIMNLNEVAEFLGLSKSTIYNLLKRKEIPATKIASTWMFNKSVLEKWVAEKSLKEFGGHNT